MVNIALLSIGNELLSGNLVNNNATIMASLLSVQGYRVSRVLVVEDSSEAIVQGLKICSSGAGVVICTGGLGPTPDDLTREAAARFLDNQKAITNHYGTAPGIYGQQHDTHFFFLPGVTYEMEGLLRDKVLPLLRQILPYQWRIQRTLHTFGTRESLLAEKLAPIESTMPSHIHLAYLPGLRRVSLRLWAQGTGKNENTLEQITHYEQQIIHLLGNVVYGKDGDTLEQVVLQRLEKAGWTLATAESCTGGAIAQHITRVPGSSKSFKGAIIAYHNQIKTNLLNVNATDIEKYGAVSREVAVQMAHNARKILSADVALAATGIAGPQGGTKEKPVGTVWIALSTQHKTVAEKIIMGKERKKNVHVATQYALNMLRLELEKGNCP